MTKNGKHAPTTNGSVPTSNGASIDAVEARLDRASFLSGRQPTTNEIENRKLDLQANALMLGREFLNKFLDPRRSIEDECGFPSQTTPYQAQDYWDIYEREPIANRAVNLMPRESWQATPLVYETEDGDEATAFEKAWDELGKGLKGDASWHQDEQGSIVWSYLKRLDELSGVGSFGILLLGLTDGRELQDPADGVEPDGRYGGVFGGYPGGAVGGADGDKPNMSNLPPTERLSSMAGTEAQYGGVQFAPKPQGKSGKEVKLVYLRVFPEHLVQIVQYESDPSHPRFGQPVMYRVTLNDPRQQHSGIGLSMATVRVHWSRVIHLARLYDNSGPSEVFATPVLKPILNNVLSLKKVYGGDAEAFWKNCLMKLILETLPEWADLPADDVSVKNQLEKWGNGLQNWLSLTGFSGKTIAPAVVDPKSHVDVQIEAVCIQLSCPVRVFKGSERGELASSQDDASWNDRLRARQNQFNTPHIIVAFVDRLIAVGVLPEPKEGGKSGDEAGSEGEEATTNARSSKKVRRVIRVLSPGEWREPVVNEKKEVVEEGRWTRPPRIVVNTVHKSEGGYSVEWPDLDSLTDKDKAAIFLQRVQAYAAAIAGNVESLFTPIDMMTKLDGMDEEEAEAIIDAAAKAVEEKEADDQALADEHGMIPEPPEGFQHSEPEPPPPEPPAAVKVKPGEKLVLPPQADPQGTPKPKPGQPAPAAK